MKTELEKFYGLIEEIKVAMMTTRRPDGHLESRAMANQKQADGTTVTDARRTELVKRFGSDHGQAVWDAGLAATATIDETIRAVESRGLVQA
jgi:general stress protein 26